MRYQFLWGVGLVIMFLTFSFPTVAQTGTYLVWYDGFDDYPVGQWPSGWTGMGNAPGDGNYVDDAEWFEGGQSLRLEAGDFSGCWEALAFHKLDASAPFTLKFAIYITGLGGGGCHANFGSVSLNTRPGWSYPGRTLISFRNDGTIVIPGGTLGSFSPNRWYAVWIDYERSGDKVRLAYWINGQYAGDTEVDAIAEEDELAYVGLHSGDSQVWFDSVSVEQCVVTENSPPYNWFEYEPENPRVGEIIDFYGYAVDDDGWITSWLWDLGDGWVYGDDWPQGAEYIHLQHAYEEPGTYGICMTVWDNQGAESKVCTTIYVEAGQENEPPNADFTWSPTEPKVGETVQFTDDSNDPDGTIVSWRWVFGDGTSSTSRNPTHVYGQAGTYDVCLTVTDDDGATATICKSLTVQAAQTNQSPTADFTWTPTEPSVNETVHFSDRSTDPDGHIASWHWNFGDGSTSTSSAPTHAYSQSGDYNVCLTVTDDEGATDTRCKTIHVVGGTGLQCPYPTELPDPDADLSPVSPTPFTLPKAAQGLAYCQGYIWAKDWDGNLFRIDPNTGTVEDYGLPISVSFKGLSSTGFYLLAVNATREIIALEPGGGTVSSWTPIPLPPGIDPWEVDDLAWDGQFVWLLAVAQPGERHIYKLSPYGVVKEICPINPNGVESITYGDGYLWEGDWDTGYIYKVDPETGNPKTGNLVCTYSTPFETIYGLAWGESGVLWASGRLGTTAQVQKFETRGEVCYPCTGGQIVSVPSYSTAKYYFKVQHHQPDPAWIEARNVWHCPDSLRLEIPRGCKQFEGKDYGYGAELQLVQANGVPIYANYGEYKMRVRVDADNPCAIYSIFLCGSKGEIDFELHNQVLYCTVHPSCYQKNRVSFRKEEKVNIKSTSIYDFVLLWNAELACCQILDIFGNKLAQVCITAQELNDHGLTLPLPRDQLSVLINAWRPQQLWKFPWSKCCGNEESAFMDLIAFDFKEAKTNTKAHVFTNSGWNLVSVPYSGAQFSPSNLVLWHWNAVENKYDQVNPGDAQPWYGYWLKVPEGGAEVTVQGEEIDHDVTVEIPVPGWQMISAPWPYATGALRFVHNGEEKSFADAIEAGWVANVIWGFDPEAYQYYPAITLDPWQGYWLKFLVGDITLKLIYADRLEFSSLAFSPVSPSSEEMESEPPPSPPPSLPHLTTQQIRVIAIPNPVEDVNTTTFRVLAPEGSQVKTLRIKIFDLSGRLVWSGEAKGSELVWHAQNLSGAYLANGVYLYQAQVETNGSWITLPLQKLAILR